MNMNEWTRRWVGEDRNRERVYYFEHSDNLEYFDKSFFTNGKDL